MRMIHSDQGTVVKEEIWIHLRDIYAKGKHTVLPLKSSTLCNCKKRHSVALCAWRRNVL